MNRTTEKSSLILLVWTQDRRVHHAIATGRAVAAIASCARHGSRYETTVVSPIETNPGAALGKLIL